MDHIRRQIEKLESLLPEAMAVDRLAAQRELGQFLQGPGKHRRGQRFANRLARLQSRLEGSCRRREQRLKNLPGLQFNEKLPIHGKKDEIIDSIQRHAVVVVSGETGSGKTTQLPKLCLAAGRGTDGLVGCTQPRRIAATTVAHRIAEELGEETGQSVGYKIRFRDRSIPHAYIKIMTDGILLAETQSDPLLGAYDTIIVDEAHERSLNIDFILGFLKTLLGRREDLKLIITSATIDTAKFARAFGNAPIIEVSGRMYPVEVRYTEPETEPAANGEPTHVDLAVRAVDRISAQTRSGDMLVFMPTEQDIRETCDLISAVQPTGLQVMPLFARLTGAEQKKVFARSAQRKIIVATNVAETSITIPGIKYVIDSGLARISRYSPRTRTTSLPITAVSKSSADQRKGRCGRIENGVCIRLYTEDDYENRPRFTPPEIIRANLAEVILRMISLNLGDITEFPFIDRPDLKHIKDGFNLLLEMDAIEPRTSKRGRKTDFRRHKTNAGGRKTADGRPKTDGSGPPGPADRVEQSRVPGPDVANGDQKNIPYQLTTKGRMMARIPLDPRLSRMLIEARKQDCVSEIAIIAAVLSIQEPRERPAEKTREADLKHAEFVDPESDFLTYLNIWDRYHRHRQKVKSNNQMKRYCREHFISYKRMREWQDVHSQILGILSEHEFWKSAAGSAVAGKNDSTAVLRFRPGSDRPGRGRAETVRNGKDEPGTGTASSGYGALHKAVLSGFLSNIAQKKEKNVFRAAREREVMIFPGSGLFDRAGSWVVAAEVVETSRVFARSVANIDSAWLEEIGGRLCKYTYLNPHWEKNRGEVVATEQVTLFGLIIVPERKVSYGKVNPQDASDIFIRSALVNGEVKKPLPFMAHNQKLIGSIRDLENRLRRRDLLISEPELFSFYRERLPLIYDIRKLSTYLKRKGDDEFLRMRKQDLILYDPDQAAVAQYPNRLELAGHSFNCSYAFEPGENTDGITIRIPATMASTVPAETLDWMVPGFFAEKIEGLIKGLPKSYRKKLVPIKDTVDIICRELPKTEGSLGTALSQFIYRRFRLDIPAAVWSDEALPDHLRMRIAISAPDGKEIRSGRDPSILNREVPDHTESHEFKRLRRKWEKSNLTAWDFGDLPDSVRDPDPSRHKCIAYPALMKDTETDKRVHLRLFQQREKALSAHVEGVLTLYTIHFANDLKFLKRQLRLPPGISPSAANFGGARQFERKLYRQVVQSLFAANIRSRREFYKRAEQNGPLILSSGVALLESTQPVLTACHEASRQLTRLRAGCRRNPNLAALLDELINGLQRLVPDNFAELYDKDRCDHLPRYIKAIMIRGERALADFEKDKVKAAEIQRFSDSLNRLLQTLSPSASDEKRRAIEAYFWMLEEYKVSVFAQELKTAIPISAKRLKRKLEEIERMV